MRELRGNLLQKTIDESIFNECRTSIKFIQTRKNNVGSSLEFAGCWRFHPLNNVVSVLILST